jgi:bifunctional non-homologous end joining protein LigD
MRRIAKKSGRGAIIAGIVFTHPDKILFTGEGITKRQLAEYYEAAAPRLLPHVAGRPLSLLRCPNGINRTCFFQRHISTGLPPHVKTVAVRLHETRDYLYIEDRRGLMELVQMGVIEIHIWGAHVGELDKPDRIVFDLDPAEGVAWSRVKQAACDIRARLHKSKLQSFLMVTGGKGLHVVVPVQPGPDWQTVKGFARGLAKQMAQDEPELYTASPRKLGRKNRIFIDYLRNDKGASAIAPYAVRAKANAPVAMPIDWDELDKIPNAHFCDMPYALRRLKAIKRDPWNDMKKLRQVFPNGMPGLPEYSST